MHAIARDSDAVVIRRSEVGPNVVYLIDNPPVRSQFRSPRRERPSGVVVVHSAENVPDAVAPDLGAEGVARFISARTTPGSYHDLADSDSIIQLVRYGDEAFQDGTGSNPHAYSVSAAVQAAKWPTMPADWTAATVRNMAAAAARYAKWLQANYGITIPARRITRAQSDARVPGFISHAERDPERRTDPGKDFPWDVFLATYADLTEPGRFLMALDDNEQAELLARVRGLTDPYGISDAVWGKVLSHEGVSAPATVVLVDALRAAQAAAANSLVAATNSGGVRALSDADLAAIAKAVNDEQARRLES